MAPACYLLNLEHISKCINLNFKLKYFALILNERKKNRERIIADTASALINTNPTHLHISFNT